MDEVVFARRHYTHFSNEFGQLHTQFIFILQRRQLDTGHLRRRALMALHQALRLELRQYPPNGRAADTEFRRQSGFVQPTVRRIDEQADPSAQLIMDDGEAIGRIQLGKTFEAFPLTSLYFH